MRLYLDSNVFISVMRSEMDSSVRLLFRDGEDFFSLCKAQGIELVISDLFLKEVKRKTFLEKRDVEEFFGKEKIRIVASKTCGRKGALEIANATGIHFSDAMHVCCALQSGCNAIVTWNKKDFEKARDLIQCFNPVEFVQYNS